MHLVVILFTDYYEKLCSHRFASHVSTVHTDTWGCPVHGFILLHVSSPRSFLNMNLPGLSSQEWPSDLVKKVKSVLETNEKSRALSKPMFKFELTKETALKNFLVMRKHNLSLKDALEAQKNLPLAYGSEFRRVEDLETIFGFHTNWAKVKKTFVEGSNWKLKPITEEEIEADFKEALSRGNHKGANEQPDQTNC